MGNGKLVVKFEAFEGLWASWDTLFGRAAAFASKVGAERLINISHSADHSRGLITVWYWGDPE